MEQATARPSRRHAAQAATGAAIVDAADRLFRQHGYVATTIGMIAREAGAAVQTVYITVGGKAAVLSAVLDRSAAGTEDRPVVEFLADRIDRAGDARAVIAVLADWLAEANARTHAVHRVIAQAAAVDPEIATLQTRRAQQRLERYGRAAVTLRERGGLRPELSDAEAAATIWSIGSPATWEALVLQAGWSTKTHRDWMERTLRAALLTEAAG
ncbi:MULTISPECIES: TetR/AcrR family transcriptional regulator [Microbacterium]|uniref:TetR/AcrR family transcriptional regulator n=1 Tax=Microbacterium TaxID=33882 RepID=UPI00217E19BC|nr:MULTISPECIES: TetR/AcrR family transcriptional regulator [Microbacterium]UWF77654.1 helix-turn-helix transcriptional regulator [Microbacterium neungamense]WCM55823.1 helix-turn-helix transcriptional regulator [Microbacterium sp. EF45047]